MNLETTGTVSPPEAPPARVPQTHTHHHPVRIAAIVVLVIAALVAAWFLAPWRGAFGLSLPVSGGTEQGFCRESAASPTQFTVGVEAFATIDAQGVTLQDITLKEDANNLRIIDARIFQPQSSGSTAFGMEDYPPASGDVVSQQQWDTLPHLAGFHVPETQASTSGHLQIVVGLEVIDPAQAATTSGFVLRYHQYLRSYAPDTGVAVNISAPGGNCEDAG